MLLALPDLSEIRSLPSASDTQTSGRMTLERTATNQSNRSRRSCSESHNSAATKVKSNQETYASGSDPLVGHLNHLTHEQTDALKEFKAVVTEKGLYTPAVGDKAASHDDATLLYGIRVVLAVKRCEGRG